MNHGPIPTRLAFISDLPSLPQGTKVRFLGCVTKYALTTGILTLQHAYPPPPHPCATVEVDAKLLLETMKSSDTRIGEWVNVMGYIECGTSASCTKDTDQCTRTIVPSGRRGLGTKPSAGQCHEAKVQAGLLWSAGAVNLGDYEKNLANRKRVEKESSAEFVS